jgi:demethylmenaquinone methyltransferase/2-methoxy-6-polyprenyl-1,4-benzoquinol methylase
MPFRSTFNCLWCGTAWTVRGPDDIEGWAQLCPDCVGKAGDNGFLRFRVREAIEERGRAASGVDSGTGTAAGALPTTPRTGRSDVDQVMRDYYDARAPEYDDWYLRRGRYAHGPVHDTAWHAELDAAGRWLDSLPFSGEIVELAAGTGWWSPLLASKGTLSMYDTSQAALDLGRDRLVAHGLRAHLHVRDVWEEPDRQVDAVFVGFWLSHVPAERLAVFLALVRRWLRPSGLFAFIDSMPDPQSSAVDHPPPADGTSVRRLADGREFSIVKVFREPAALEAALSAAGFETVDVTTTGRFFLLGRGTAAASQAT